MILLCRMSVAAAKGVLTECVLSTEKKKNVVLFSHDISQIQCCMPRSKIWNSRVAFSSKAPTHGEGKKNPNTLTCRMAIGNMIQRKTLPNTSFVSKHSELLLRSDTIQHSAPHCKPILIHHTAQDRTQRRHAQVQRQCDAIQAEQRRLW